MLLGVPAIAWGIGSGLTRLRKQIEEMRQTRDDL